MQISLQQFLDKYGHLNVKFYRYHQFVFSYDTVDTSTEICGFVIYVRCGGDHETAYRHEAVVGMECPISLLNDIIGATIYEDSKLVPFEFVIV
jgi:hypothetical protein